MPFVKLDVRLLESTLWEDFDGTRVFTAALLMAEPREFLGAIAELEVDANTETGFVLQPGWYGFVPASGPGIVRRAMLDQPRGLAALRRLVAEDGQSRTVQHAGKRLMRVDGGFIVLNFMAYRERDMSGAERARRYRLRKAGKSAPPEAGIRQTPRRAAKSPTGLSTESSTVTRDALPSLDLSVDKSSSSHRDAHAYDTDRHATVTVRRDITEAEAEVEPLTLSLPPGEEGQDGGKPPSKPSRADGTNPRATGSNPRARGTNPRAQAPQGLEGGSTAVPITSTIRGRWWLTFEGITAKGRELGIDARRGESPQAFKQRVQEAVQLREDAIAAQSS